MVAVVTLRVTDCRTSNAIAGAAVTDGYNTVFTNGYGEIAVYWDDTVYVGYGVQVSKSGYQTRPVNLYNNQSGTTVSTCLDAASTGGGSTGGGGGGGGGGGLKCFIVTAATGSELSSEVAELRTLRKAVAERAPAAGRLIEAIYAEYWQFSPALADKISVDDLLKEGTLVAAVQPLLAWYRLAGALALGGDVEQARTGIEAACPIWMQPAAIASLIRQIRQTRRVPADAPRMVQDLAEHLARAASLPLVDWAILEPLETAWESAGRQGDPVAAVAEWLSRAPVGPMAVSGSAELAQVAELVGFDAAAQSRLKARIGSSQQGCGCS